MRDSIGSNIKMAALRERLGLHEYEWMTCAVNVLILSLAPLSWSLYFWSMSSVS